MQERLVGLDLARLVAVAGMVVVHGWTDLVLLPLERAGAVLPAGPEGPAWAVLLQAVLTDRARPLFVLLAGVGVTLMVARTGAGPGVLRLRAASLGALGFVLLGLGWSDLVLVAYAVLFLLAVVLVRLPSPPVVVLAVGAWSLPVVAGPRDRRRPGRRSPARARRVRLLLRRRRPRTAGPGLGAAAGTAGRGGRRARRGRRRGAAAVRRLAGRLGRPGRRLGAGAGAAAHRGRGALRARAVPGRRPRPAGRRRPTAGPARARGDRRHAPHRRTSPTPCCGPRRRGGWTWAWRVPPRWGRGSCWSRWSRPTRGRASAARPGRAGVRSRPCSTG